MQRFQVMSLYVLVVVIVFACAIARITVLRTPSANPRATAHAIRSA